MNPEACAWSRRPNFVRKGGFLVVERVLRPYHWPRHCWALNPQKQHWGLWMYSQGARALDSQHGGREFESQSLHLKPQTVARKGGCGGCLGPQYGLKNLCTNRPPPFLTTVWSPASSTISRIRTHDPPSWELTALAPPHQTFYPAGWILNLPD